LIEIQSEEISFIEIIKSEVHRVPKFLHFCTFLHISTQCNREKQKESEYHIKQSSSDYNMYAQLLKVDPEE